MDQSLKLFNVRGIAIRVHMTFPLILIWAALQFGILARGGWSGALFGIVTTLFLFVIVVLHELGHSFAAQHYGVEVKQIVLLPIGGVAQLAEIPENPRQEFVIAIAGPAVNFALAIFFGSILFTSGTSLSLTDLPGMLFQLGRTSLASIGAYLFAANLLLGLFNLLPAFPMDGGRVLRALLATKLSYPRATTIAAAIGQSLALLMGLWAFLQGDFFLVLVGIFIFTGASQERNLVLSRNALAGLKVRQAFSRQARFLSPDDELGVAVELTLQGFQADFPVCDQEQVVGILTHSRLVQALTQYGAAIRVREVMDVEFTPISPDQPLMDAQRQFAERHSDALPVIENGRFLGLLTSRDLVEVLQLASIPNALRPGTTETSLASEQVL